MRRMLIIGCGDVGLRLAKALKGRWRIYALTHSRDRLSRLRAEGIMPVSGDLDHPQTLVRIAGLAQDVVHLAPPPGSGIRDTRTVNLIRALAKGGSLPQRLVYISTSGVYGDCAGEVIDETRRARPSSDRARRRLDAEQQIRGWGAETGVQVSILRVPGIYSAARLPIARLKAAYRRWHRSAILTQTTSTPTIWHAPYWQRSHVDAADAPITRQMIAG